MFDTNAAFIRCSRCASVISLVELERLSRLGSATSAAEDEILSCSLITPTKEQIEVFAEEWYCPLCVREDTILCENDDLLESSDDSVEETSFWSRGMFEVNEWGVSSLIPWLTHPSIATIWSKQVLDSPSLMTLLRGLIILTNSKLSNLSFSGPNGWTLKERVYVLAALCEVCKRF
jgi:hypothetical protein